MSCIWQRSAPIATGSSVLPAPPALSRESASAAPRSPASPGSPVERTGGRGGRPGPPGAISTRSGSPSSPPSSLRESSDLPPPTPSFPTLSASRSRPSSPSGERREGDRAATGPKMAAAERPGRAGGRSARRLRSLTRSRALRPSLDSVVGSAGPTYPPSTSDTLWGDSDARGGPVAGRDDGPVRGLALSTTVLFFLFPFSPPSTVSRGANRSGSCAAELLARGDGRERARRRGRGGSPRPAALLSRDLSDSVGLVRAGRSAPAHSGPASSGPWWARDRAPDLWWSPSSPAFRPFPLNPPS